MRGHRLLGITCAFALMGGSAIAAPEDGKRKPVTKTVHAARAPITPAHLRKSELALDRYESSLKVVRNRSDGKEVATFVAEPRLIDPGAVVVFEAVSEAKAGRVRRWHCIAVRDVAECLGAPLKLRYLPKDERIVLTARVLPRTAKLMAIASR